MAAAAGGGGADALKVRDYAPTATAAASPPSPSMSQPSSGQATHAQDSMTAEHAGAGEGSMLEREYVMVEKRTVEINSLADEMANQQPARRDSSQTSTAVAHRPSRGFLTRAPSNATQHVQASVGSATPYPPPQPTATTSLPFAIPGRQTSATPNTYSISSSPRPVSLLSSSPRSQPTTERFPASPLALVGSPTTAIAKALNMASLKIFGSPTDGIFLRRASARRPIPRTVQVDPDEDQVLVDLEDIAQKALVLFDFADSKIIQFMPPTPQTSSSTSLGTPSYFAHVANREQQQQQQVSNPFSAVPISPAMRRTSSSSSERPLVLASSGARGDVLAAEAMVLYLRSLAFLSKGIERARRYWSNRIHDHPASSDLNEGAFSFLLPRRPDQGLTAQGPMCSRAMVPPALQRLL